MTDKPTFEEVLQTLDEHLEDEEMERVLAMSDEEVEHELEDEGLDAEAVREKADLAFERARARAAGQVPVARPPSSAHLVVQASDAPDYREPRRLPRSPFFLAFAAALAALALAAAGAGAVAWFDRNPPTPQRNPRDYTPEPERTPDERMADAIRRDALEACGAGRLAECRNKLDDARTLDPAGDTSESVRQARGVIAKDLPKAPDDKGLEKAPRPGGAQR